MVESKSIQSSTIIEETSRANSESNLNESISAEPPVAPPPERSSVGSASDLLTSEAAGVVGDTDKSSSQSSLPIINVVSEPEDDEQAETGSSLRDVKDEIVQTEDELEEASDVRQIETIVQHHQPPKENTPTGPADEPEPCRREFNKHDLISEHLQIQGSLEEEVAEASIPEEQTLSEHNMPKTIEKVRFCVFHRN